MYSWESYKPPNEVADEKDGVITSRTQTFKDPATHIERTADYRLVADPDRFMDDLGIGPLTPAYNLRRAPGARSPNWHRVSDKLSGKSFQSTPFQLAEEIRMSLKDVCRPNAAADDCNSQAAVTGISRFRTWHPLPAEAFVILSVAALPGENGEATSPEKGLCFDLMHFEDPATGLPRAHDVSELQQAVADEVAALSKLYLTHKHKMSTLESFTDGYKQEFSDSEAFRYGKGKDIKVNTGGEGSGPVSSVGRHSAEQNTKATRGMLDQLSRQFERRMWLKGKVITGSRDDWEDLQQIRKDGLKENLWRAVVCQDLSEGGRLPHFSNLPTVSYTVDAEIDPASGRAMPIIGVCDPLTLCEWHGTDPVWDSLSAPADQHNDYIREFEAAASTLDALWNQEVDETSGQGKDVALPHLSDAASALGWRQRPRDKRAWARMFFEVAANELAEKQLLSAEPGQPSRFVRLIDSPFGGFKSCSDIMTGLLRETELADMSEDRPKTIATVIQRHQEHLGNRPPAYDTLEYDDPPMGDFDRPDDGGKSPVTYPGEADWEIIIGTKNTDATEGSAEGSNQTRGQSRLANGGKLVRRTIDRIFGGSSGSSKKH